ncbi:TetR/AcrR family transcriptional regulator [Marinobacter zhejiangensis]|uniref:Transcriptional regulator, TetR family n=1 Tax=Marinobacter zhejiangensis TaxID=488535 RepID=A0A1I4P368_9GAMM|nr:TetR/AcrR family transcriptional regulator [Marinobacter zhejiangensis]SFM22232.1 transcriptional regulator, TetR family [Marinobacter zhejiangensis]
MTDTKNNTKRRIIEAANSLFYMTGIRATSVDAIAEKAGITKRTLYYHFQSKDELITEYLSSRDQLNLHVYKKWFDEQEGDITDKIRAVFNGIAEITSHPKWRGCGFQRTAGELANKPGHPAIKAASLHKKNVESWLSEEFCHGSLKNAEVTARYVFLLLEGALSTMLVHHDPVYIRESGNAAALLVAHEMPPEDH